MLGDATQIMRAVDAWVASQGNGRWVAADSVPPAGTGAPFPDYGIQQERQETAELVSVLLDRLPDRERCLEVGLGRYGSTHILWRELFRHVVSIEWHSDRIHNFSAQVEAFYGRWVLDDRRSRIIPGSSWDPAVVRQVYACCTPTLDFLFIDGSHAYQDVLCDWLLYHPLVRPGGVIAFHDSVCTLPAFGVGSFVAELAAGMIDGHKRAITHILHSTHLGISLYEV